MDGLVGSKGGGGASIASLLDMDITKKREGEEFGRDCREVENGFCET